MKKYQIWGFSYIMERNGMNVLTGTDSETDKETPIPCFDGFAMFKVNRNGKTHYYTLVYPKINKLTAAERMDIEGCCGYSPCAGEYGVIAVALGNLIEIGEKTFEYYSQVYRLPQKTKQKLPWWGV